MFDGAMGTELYRHHVFTNRCFDELCLSDAKLIRQIHWEYCEAGADVLTTNTFGANRSRWRGLGWPKSSRNPPGGGQDRPRSGQRVRSTRVRRRIDRPAAKPTPVRGPDRGDDRRAGRGGDGRRGRLRAVRDPAQSTVAGELCVAPCGDCRTCPTCSRSWSSITANRPPAKSVERMMAPLADGAPQPVAWGMNCGAGPDGLLIAVEQAVRLRRCRWWSSPTPASQGGREPADLFLFAGVPGVIRQALRGARRGGRGRLLRHHARAHPRSGPGGQAARPGRRLIASVAIRCRGRGAKAGCPFAEKSRLAGGWPHGNG